MSSSGKLTIYSYPHGPNAFKSVIAGKFGGVTVDYPQDFKMGTDNKTPEFLKKNPLGKVPVLDTPQGPIWESNAIARYVARVGNASAQLLGKDAYEQSLVDQWIEFNNDYLTNTFNLWNFAVGYGAYNQEKWQASADSVKQAFGWIEAHLNQSSHKFLVNDNVTLADIITATNLFMALKFSLDQQFISAFPKTAAYVNALLGVDQIKSTIGEVQVKDKFTPPQ